MDEELQTGQNPISVDYKPGREPGGYFNDAQGRSYVLEYDVGQDEPDVSECPPPDTGGTTTTSSSSTTTSSVAPTTTTTTTPGTTTSSTSSTTAPSTTTSTTSPTSTSTSTTTVAPTTSTSTTTTQPPTTTTSTTLPKPSLLGIDDFAFCGDDNLPEISITFGNRPDLDGVPGLLTFSDGTDYSGNPLVFQSGQTVTFPYPASLTTPLTLTYANSGETATAVVELPADCPPEETTTSTTSSTTTTSPTSTTSSTSTTLPGTTTTSTAPTTSSTTTTVTSTSSTTTSTTLPETFTFGAAGTVCVSEVPTIRITFQNLFPSLAGVTGTMTMRDINGNVVSTQSLVYEPGTTVDILYPGTSVNPDGSVADVPGWTLNDDGFWILDPSDDFLRDGIYLTYEVNPTAGPVLVTYPPESSACANPDGPFPPGTPVVPPGVVLLPPTR